LKNILRMQIFMAQTKGANDGMLDIKILWWWSSEFWWLGFMKKMRMMTV